ncbi:MAG: sugar phosphate isomerase/epimerase [Spirochaetes bacterium]|nr:MAG: sugar phosphate isomerase/epimerase [Spirochaetota bacterium]
MMMFKTGILLDSLRTDLDDALAFAAETGVSGVQIYASPHEMSSMKIDLQEAEILKKKVQRYGLELSALCGDLGGHGFEREDENPEKIVKTKKIIDFAVELGIRIITTHIGVVSETDAEHNTVMQDALRKICSYAQRAGVFIAVETGPERSEVLKKFIVETGERNLKVNFDPANLVMVQGEDPAEAVRILRDYIVYTHAKDGRMVKKCNPEEIYGAFADGNPAGINFDDYFVELPLGRGDVNFPEYLKTLDDIGYTGYLTIEREAGDRRKKDVVEGISFLEKITGI